MKHLFIVNPAAGKGKTLKYIPEIEEVFRDRNEEYHVEITERPGHATEIVKSYVNKDAYRVYSIGGDGTVNEVLNGIAGSSSILGVIPSGSGNDFIRSLSTGHDVQDIIRRTVDGSERVIDIAKVNDKYFVNISSVGFDAEVVYNTIRLKKLPLISGSLAYMTSIILTLLRYKCSHLEILIDGKHFDTKSLLIAIANGRFYGGGMLAAPDAQLEDGLFDICLVKEVGRLKILNLFPRFIKGKHGEIPEVSFYRGSKVYIRSKETITLNIDGEIERVTEASFEILPCSIRVILPLSANELPVAKNEVLTI